MNTRAFLSAIFTLGLAYSGAAMACECDDKLVFIHFEDMDVGAEVIGLGTVSPNLNIQSIHFTDVPRVIETGYGVKGSCDPGVPGPCMPFAFGAPNHNLVPNNCLEDEFGNKVELTAPWPGPDIQTAKGFADVEFHNADTPQELRFTFGHYKAKSFEILVVDHGDFNAGPDAHGDTNTDPKPFHMYGLYGFADKTADHHDTNWVDSEVIVYQTHEVMHPRDSWNPTYGDLFINGDACSVDDQFNRYPGHHKLRVQSDTGLGAVYLLGWTGTDPHVGFDSIRLELICEHEKGCPLAEK